MASVTSTLFQIKQQLHAFLPDAWIHRACGESKYRWRQRQLGPVQTIHLFILQILNLNIAMSGLGRAGQCAVKAAAYCRARMRLPLSVLEKLLVHSSSVMRQAGDCGDGRWCGLKTYLVDGSSTIAPDTESSQKAFGQPHGCKKGCGFPVPKILGLFDAFSGMLVQMLCFPLYTHEQSKVSMLHPLLGAGDLLVGDRGFCSFVHLAMLTLRGIHALFRMHQATIVDFRPYRKRRQTYRKGRKARRQKKQSRRRKGKGKDKKLPRSKFIRRLGKHDQIVEWFRPKVVPRWTNKKQLDALPESLQIRELRFTLPRQGQRTVCVTIATTLLDPIRYPKEKIAELYGVRWRVETHFAQLKTTLEMRKLKSQTADGVKKELVVYALVFNLVHAVMLKAARRQHVTPDRISFIDTVRWLIHSPPGEPLPDLLINPHRPGRHEPRVTKDREDTYTKMTRPRAELKRELKKQGQTLK